MTTQTQGQSGTHQILKGFQPNDPSIGARDFFWNLFEKINVHHASAASTQPSTISPQNSHQTGEPMMMSLSSWNLPEKVVAVDASLEQSAISEATSLGQDVTNDRCHDTRGKSNKYG